LRAGVKIECRRSKREGGGDGDAMLERKERKGGRKGRNWRDEMPMSFSPFFFRAAF